MERLLPATSEYPDGVSVEPIDTEELDGATPPGLDDLDSVEPADCASAMEDNPAELPEEAVQAAGQVSASGGGSADKIYSYALVSGDFEEEVVDEGAFERVLSECSSMTVVSEGVEMEGGISGRDFDALPEEGGAFTMDLSEDAHSMAMWTAFGQVEDVYFALIGMDLDAAADMLPGSTDDDCDDDQLGFECFEEQREEADAESRDESEAEFEEFLNTAVETLESGL